MKIKYYRNGEVVRINIEGYSNILGLLYEMRDDYIVDNGKEPIGFIMGPNDYAHLVKELHSGPRYCAGEYGVTYPSQVMGLPIRLKEFDGIELEIELEAFYRYIR